MNGDGYDDLFIMTSAGAFAVTAANTADPTAGLTFGPTTAITSSQTPLNDFAFGDFNDDGIMDVAWVGATFGTGYLLETIYFASICPGAVANTICADASALQVVLDSTTIALPSATGCGDNISNAITSGNFTGTATQLMAGAVTIYNNPSSGQSVCQLVAYLYDFDGEFTPTLEQTVTLVSDPDYFPVAVFAASAPFNWFGTTDQAVFASSGAYISGGGGNVNFSVQRGVNVVTSSAGTLVQDGVFNRESSLGGKIYGLSIGVMGTPTNGFTTTANFTPQIGLLSVNSPGNFVEIYGVNTSSVPYVPSLASTYNLTQFSQTQASENLDLTYGGSQLRAGDLYGNSIRVGQPEVLRVSATSGGNAQPQLVLALPPQHVDYILGDSASAAAVVNFSAVDTYAAQYSIETTMSEQSSSQATTSYTNSVTQTDTETGKISFLPAFGVSGTFSQTAQETYTNTVATSSNTFASEAFDASTATTFSDVLWVTFQDYNIYNYPVLGQTACPIGDSNCTTPGQLFLTVSGPDSVETASVVADTVEWYQPVEEPLQILSYACSATDLESRISDPALLTAASPIAFFTDTSTLTESVQWSEGSGSEVTTGSTTTSSFSTDNSITMGTPNLTCEANGADLTSELSYNSSNAVGTLNDNITMVGASTGFEIIKPGTFPDTAVYQYPVQPFIFGQTATDGTVQTISLSTDVQTVGPIATAFAVNSLTAQGTGVGSWWASGANYNNYIDVAVNHPDRWTVQIYSEYTSNPLPAPCVSRGSAGDSDCAVFNYYDDTTDLWDNTFYWMRGLLVTVGGFAGPQQTNATDGDDVFLQARVYNYSLMDMPSDETIHVRFYRQEIDEEYNPVGDSVLLNSGGSDILLAPLDAFASQDCTTVAANWTVATTSFSTTGLGGTFQIFWVVVWAEDSSGNLVTELPGHGLSAIPGTLTAIGDVPLEMVTFNDPLAQIGSQTVTTSFSNNVGYLHQAFYIAPSTTTTTPTATTPTPTTTGTTPTTTVALSAVVIPTPSPALALTADSEKLTVAHHGKVVISSTVSSPASRDGLAVLFYDGTTKGTAFDMEILPHLSPSGTNHVRVPYTGRDCGTHDIVIVAAPGKRDQVSAHMTLVVDCTTPTVTGMATPSATATITAALASTATATLTSTATSKSGHAPRDGNGCEVQSAPERSGWMMVLWGTALVLAMVRGMNAVLSATQCVHRAQTRATNLSGG